MEAKELAAAALVETPGEDAVDYEAEVAAFVNRADPAPERPVSIKRQPDFKIEQSPFAEAAGLNRLNQ